jgi:ribonuclease-3
LLLQALTHISYAKQKDLNYNYERLEFLGDSVVNFLIVDILTEKFTRMPLKKLAAAKAFLISENFLSKLAKKWNVQDFIYLSRSEEIKGRRNSPSVLADVFEAIWAAIYVDSGRSIDFVKRLFRYHFEEEIIEAVRQGLYFDYKSILQEITQSMFKEKPSYELVKAEGPPHDQTFTVECKVKEFSTLGEGKTKKEAEQKAAQKMVEEHFKEKLQKKTKKGKDNPQNS